MPCAGLRTKFWSLENYLHTLAQGVTVTFFFDENICNLRFLILFLFFFVLLKFEFLLIICFIRLASDHDHLSII